MFGWVEKKEAQYGVRHLTPQNLPELRRGMKEQLSVLMNVNANSRVIFLPLPEQYSAVERHLMGFVLKYR